MRKFPVTPLLAALALLLAQPITASAQAADVPSASDFPEIHRPAGSSIVGTRHIDHANYDLALGPIERSARKPDKTRVLTGTIDSIAYTGPRNTPSLATYTGLVAQLKSEGFTQLYTCARAGCGSGFQLAIYLADPIITTLHTGNRGADLIAALESTNDDVRFGAFQKGDVYMEVLATLNPGQGSGAVLVRIAPTASR